MASPPLSRKAKMIRSAKTPQSLLCSRPAVASFTPLGLHSFSASGTNVVSGSIPITAPMSDSAFAGNFAFWNFFLFFKLLTCCGIQNFFDYGLVWEWMSWVLCWVSILWMVWFGCGFVWVFLWLLLLMLFDLVIFMFFFFFPIGWMFMFFDVHALWLWICSLILGLMSLLGCGFWDLMIFWFWTFWAYGLGIWWFCWDWKWGLNFFFEFMISFLS